MATCNICSTNITKERFPGIKCGGSCGNFFHNKCAVISDALLEGIKNRSAHWLCKDCRDTANQSIIDDNDSPGSANTINLSDIMHQLKRMENKLSSLEELKDTVSMLLAENKSITSKIHTLEDKLSKQTIKLHRLEAEIDKPIQQQNDRSIIISGLPVKHDDIRGVIINAIKKLGVEINTDDIISIQASHKSNTVLDSGKNNNTSKSVLRSFFIVKLKTVDLKNTILTQTKKHKTLSCKDLDVSLPENHPMQRIFVMHHLTPFQSKLYHEAKNIKLKYKYKFLWCKNGQIYLRNSEGSDAHRIQSFGDIFRIERSHHPIEDSTAE